MALTTDRLVIPPAASINAAASMRSLSLVANGAVVPLVYGTVRTQPMVLNIIKHASDATLFLAQVLWARGACQAITDLKINNATDLVSASTHYLDGGTVNTTLAAAFTAQGITYADTLTGFCNSTLTLLTAKFTGELKIEATLQGKKVYDPRKDTTAGGSGSHRLATPSTWEYSDNPSLCLADFLYSSVYGAGVAVDWASVITAANANDALVGSPSEKHRTLNVMFAAQASTTDVAEALRAYAGVWLLPTASGVKLLPDTTGASVATYAHASGNIAAMGALEKKDISNVPTVVEVVYTNTDANAPNSPTLSVEVAVAGAGSTRPWRKSTINLPGINRYSQAKREATERLNKLNVVDLQTSMEVFDIGARHELGDIITVTHPVGVTSKLFRINDIQRVDHGRWLLGLAEYQASAYDTTVATAATYPDYGVKISDTIPGWSGVNLFWPAQQVSVPGGTYGGTVGLNHSSQGYFRYGGVDLGGYGFQPGEVVTLSADVWCDATCAAAGQGSELYLFTTDSGGTWKSQPYVFNYTTTPTRKSVTLTLPVSADMHNIGVGLYHGGPNASTSPTGTVYADRIQVERGPVATAYAPATALGSINTGQMAENAATSVVSYFDGSRTFLRTSSTAFTDTVVGNTYTNNTGGPVTVEILVTSMLGAACNTAGRTLSAKFYLSLSTDQTGVPAFPGEGPTISGSGVFATGGQFATTFTMQLDNGKYVTPVMNAYQVPGGGSAEVSVAFSDLSMRVTAIKR